MDPLSIISLCQSFWALKDLFLKAWLPEIYHILIPWWSHTHTHTHLQVIINHLQSVPQIYVNTSTHMLRRPRHMP